MEKKGKFWKSESRQISFLVSRISSHVESRSFVPLRFSLTRLSVKLCFFACCTASYETWIFTSEMVAWRYNKISRPYLSIVDSKEHAPKEEFRFSFCERTRWNATKTTTEESRWVISRKIRDKMTFPPELARNCANKIALSFPGCETPRQSKTVSVPFKHSSTILPPFDRLIIPER